MDPESLKPDREVCYTLIHLGPQGDKRLSTAFHILEEGNSRLFLVAEAYPHGGRRFRLVSQCLEVLDQQGQILTTISLAPIEHTLIKERRGIWLECRGDTVVLDIEICCASEKA